ncbi:MAG: hypothetical protein K9G41_00005 [Flavobacteriales bacterium]|nr:hypothetical protein [Flavobacteriales bacterium]
MKQHRGIRPQDIVVLLKIASKGTKPWLMKHLSEELNISASEVSESLNRSVLSGLIAADKTTLMRSALLEFLRHGIQYTFPQRPSALVRGMVTAHSAEPLRNLIESHEPIVWPYAEGNVRGHGIEPLHPSVPIACERDSHLYQLLALVDALRIGRVREKELAMVELENLIRQ